MKFSLTLALLITISTVYAQKSEPVEEISAMEQKGYERRSNLARIATTTSSFQNFDIKYYRCEWEVDPAVKFISGKVTTHFVMTSASDVIEFDLSDNLGVSVIKRGNSALTFEHSNSLLTVHFPTIMAAGTKDSLSITYSGIPAENGSFVATTHGSGGTLAPIVWTLSEPFGSKDWWPCKNGLDDKADSIDVYLTHPSNYKAASNGLLQSETPIWESRTVTHWKHRYPIASYLVCIAISNYSVLNDAVVIGPDKFVMQTFCYPESLVSFQNGSLLAMQGLTFYSSLFGAYPFKKEKYGHVQFGWGGGMEHQTNSFMVNMSEGLIAHELAHQWFGDKITCGNWEDVWLNEGFATHLASMYMENKYPNNTKANRTKEITTITNLPDGAVKVDNLNDINRIFSNRLSYYKGSHLLYMLRWILGEPIFKTAAQNYLQDPSLAYGFATTSNFKSHLEAASGKNLDYFFDQWYSGQGYPSYQVEWFPINTSVQVKLNQITSHASVSFFQLPVPLLFRNSITNEEKLVVLNNTFSGQIFIENLGFEADQIVFDPDVWLITRNNTLTKTSGGLPVTFTTFRADCARNGVILSWGTTEETNADHFNVEKSVDAINWNVIGSVRATGDSRVLTNYDFLDSLANSRRLYYRIVEVDHDSTKQYTRILANSCSFLPEEPPQRAFSVTVAPNPVKCRLVFWVDGFGTDKLEGSIYNSSGIIVIDGLENISSVGSNDVDISSLPTGLYILSLRPNDRRRIYSVKFLKE